jgi:hypothetical protein
MKLLIFPFLLITLISHQSTLADYSHKSQVQTNNFGIEIDIKDLSPFWGVTYYDFQSNSISREIWEDPNDPVNMHVTFIRDVVGNPTFSFRRAAYLFSSDFGESWANLGDATIGEVSAFPCISGTYDGRVVILCNSSATGGNYRAQIFIDLAPGIGVFDLRDPGGVDSTYPVYPVGIVNSSNRILFLASSGGIYRNSCTNIAPPGTFTGYTAISNTGTSIVYSVAAKGNRAGVVYVTGESSTYSAGSVFFMESLDSGSTWGTPVQIWNANYSTDSIGAFRGVDVTYQGLSPKVLFDLCKRTETSYYPKSSSKIMSWSPGINGGVPVLVDSAGGLTGSNPTNDGFTSMCRGVIGCTNDSLFLCAAWCKARNDTDAAGNNYYDIWISISGNGGQTWDQKTQVTNNSGPLRDCRYVSVSPINRRWSFYDFTFHLLFQMDSIPGSYVNGSARSLAKMMYAKVSSWIDAIASNNSEVPDNFILKQNYPNPFNPSTVIEYGLSKSANVKLTVSDITGREIRTLAEGFQSAGYHTAEFSANGLASGIYFYRMEISDENKLVYTESKKMLLVK